ncbi:MAG: HEAT repeat domain-containing protein [Thermoanaerobaculia bacterium]
MWELFLLILAGGTVTWRILLRDQRRRLEAWDRAATLCGLRKEASSTDWAWQLKFPSRVGSMAVRIEEIRGREGGSRIVIGVPERPGFPKVKIRREQQQETAGVREIETGDELFDLTFSIEGPRPLVFALLDRETRRLLSSLNGRSRLEVSLGELQAEMPDSEVPRLLPLLLDVAQRFAQPTSVARRLADNAHQDAVERVRLLNLLVLISDLHREPETLEALRHACSDPSPQIRLQAARELGLGNRDVLLELAEGPAEDAVSAQAVAILGQGLPLDRARTLLGHALGRRRLETARACLVVLGQSEDPAVIDVLAKVLARERGELADASAEALGESGSPAAEAPLILALERETPEVRVAAAKALGHVGSAAAVTPLKEATERFPHDPELRRATRQSIAEIQSRLPGASPGQLSLAGIEAGQLSLAQAEAGELSFVADPAGELSFPPGEAGQLSFNGD